MHIDEQASREELVVRRFLRVKRNIDVDDVKDLIDGLTRENSISKQFFKNKNISTQLKKNIF